MGAFLMSHSQAMCASGEVQRHEGGLRPLAPRLDSNSKQDQQTDKYEESDRIQVDQGCGELPDEQDQIDLTDYWNERQEPPRE